MKGQPNRDSNLAPLSQGATTLLTELTRLARSITRAFSSPGKVRENCRFFQGRGMSGRGEDCSRAGKSLEILKLVSSGQMEKKPKAREI